MQNCEPLAWYGAVVLIVVSGFMLVPYLRGKANLISAWNLLLLGIAIFLGLGSLEAATYSMRFRGLEWFEPTKDEVSWFMATSTVFLVALLVSYYYDPVSRALAARSLTNWPPVSTGVIVYVLLVCGVVILAAWLLAGRTFVGPALLKLNHKAIIFIGMFGFLLWYRNKLNPIWFGVFIATFIFAVVLAILSGGGRRLPLSLLFAPVIYIYMAHVRLWRPTRGIIAMGVAFLALFVAGLMYSSIRHFDRAGATRGRTAANLLSEIRSGEFRGSESNWWERFASNKLFHFSQQVVHYSLVTDRFVRAGQLDPQPFHTFKFLAIYPIPRKIWPEKPRPLGYVSVREIAEYKSASASWGCGIVGHAAYEGGLLLAALYAYLAVFGVRMIDDPMRRHPTNPFLIAILATASTHIVAWPRGDLALMTIEIAQCFLFAIILGIVGRLFFGTERSTRLTPVALPRVPFVLRPTVR